MLRASSGHAELAARFGRAPQPGEDPLAGGRYTVESYLEYHGEMLARRIAYAAGNEMRRVVDVFGLNQQRAGLIDKIAVVVESG